MFYLDAQPIELLGAALLGALLTLLLASLVLWILHVSGVFTLPLKRRRASRTARLSDARLSMEGTRKEELSEEELVVILTAAAVAALADEDKNRFRVVAFRRVNN